MATVERSELANGPHGQLVRIAAIGGVVGPIAFAVLVFAGGALTAGYSHASQKISELAVVGAPFAWLQTFAFLLMGFAVLGLAWALWEVLGPPRLGAVLIGIFAVASSMLGAALPCDPGCAGVTTVGLLHNVFGLLGFIAAIAGMLVLARRWRTDSAWSGHVRFTLAAAIVALVGLVGFVVVSAGGIEGVAGVAQRVFAFTLLAWIAVTSLRLSREVARWE